MRYNLPVIILNRTVLLPSYEIKLEFDDDISKSIIEESEYFHNNNILVVTKTSLDENLILDELPVVATIAHIDQKLELPNGKTRIILKGMARAGVLKYLSPTNTIIESIVTVIPVDKIDEDTNNCIIRKLFSELDSYIEKVPYVSNSLLALIQEVKDLDILTDIIVNHIPLEYERLLEYLFTTSSVKRSQMILEDIYKEKNLYNIEENIDKKLKKELDKDEKDYYLKEKIKLLKTELGDAYKKDDELDILKEQASNLNCKEEIKEKILSEINRYENIPNSSPEVSSVKNYIDYMLKLPWGIQTSDAEDLSKVKSMLDKNHYGLNEVKERILEFLAVKKQSKDLISPIICLVGPPGVGKTTLAYSIAKSMGRKFTKISLGGIDDYSYIKGHTRTYIGACPGKIIDGLMRTKSSNPVFLLDEVDKMQSGIKGDPSSALLEVLDPIQNKYFKDNYIEEEFDLSNVLFILTANDINNIPETLRDRLEIINVSGYTELEKLEIVKTYIIPNVCAKHGINLLKISDNDILDIIKFYTKESGLRELYRLISTIARKVVANKYINNKKIILTIRDIEKYLGAKKYSNSNIVKSEVGIANSLAYTTYGGDILPIETVFYKGNSNLYLTGSMGEVMLDSAKIALSYIKANYKLFNISYDMFKNDIHVNVPNISIKKEGPSAGCAIVTSMISALTDFNIDSSIAMTGEITLRGSILKVGGIKEKIIGAYMNNINTIFIPDGNRYDIKDIPKEIKNKIKIITVNNYEEIYKYLKEQKNV